MTTATYGIQPAKFTLLAARPKAAMEVIKTSHGSQDSTTILLTSSYAQAADLSSISTVMQSVSTPLACSPTNPCQNGASDCLWLQPNSNIIDICSNFTDHGMPMMMTWSNFTAGQSSASLNLNTQRLQAGQDMRVRACASAHARTHARAHTPTRTHARMRTRTSPAPLPSPFPYII